LSTPLTATHRFSFTYAVDGLQHVAIAYCKRQDPLIGGMGVANRDGSSLTSIGDAAQGYWDLMKQQMLGSVPVPTVLFEERSGLLWFPLAGVAVTGAAGAGANFHASQYTLVVRDTSFKKLRITWMEGALGYVGHSPSGLGLGAGADNIANGYNGVGFGAHDPYVWQKSRGDRYILAAGAIAGATLDLNDKLKRRRGLE
jgi:hypothetical protein